MGFWTMINRLKTYYQRYRWYNRFQIKKNIHQVEKLYGDCDGFELARQEKALHPNLSLTYGEIELESFLALLSLTQPTPQQVFYDLGCGLGKTVIAAAKTYQFKKSYGIETLKNLHQIAQKKQKTGVSSSDIEFIHGDLRDIHWHDADILFLNVASFVPDSWHLICDKLIQSPAPIIITCSKPLPKTHFEIQETRVQCSWGIIPAYIHRHTKNNYAQT
jgi:SAM-dependent methyltransferase